MAEQTGGSSDEPSDSPLAVGWGFWLWWVLASTVGWAAAGPVAALGLYRDIVVAGYVGVAVGGIVAGVLQWLVLRRRVARAGGWVLASIVASAVVGVVVFGVGVVNADVGWIGGAGLFGTAVGVLQWLILRQQVARAGWWVLASTVGWVAGGPAGAFLGWPALGVVYGAITGIALVWLLRQRPPGSDQPSA
jgi:hypothetical protein